MRLPKSPIQLIEEILRAKTALHLRLVAQRNEGDVEIGGKKVSDMIAEVDAGIPGYEQMLIYFKNKVAADIMAAEVSDEPELPEKKDDGRLAVQTITARAGR
jgi:hypothetical protein